MRCFVAILTVPLFASAAAAAPPAADGIELFESKIRPVLVKHCYSCHSADAKKLKGGLRLDTRAAMRQGGESGPVIVPGQPGKSVLIQALRYDGLQMPPSRKLPDAVIADFEKWISLGAPDPREEMKTAAKAKPIDFVAARRHWAYQPIRATLLPAVRDRSWPTSPIDYYILEKLEQAGLAPSPPADRRTLLRRVYYDLIGLPPTYGEVESFEKDAAPDVFAKVVDRLLDSPHYGERWGRHWLDVARYADTKDQVLLFGDNRLRPYSYTYRDYVIRAFNADTPYDRFIHEQLAADQIEPKVEPWRLGAMGYLTLGRLFCNNQPDIYDDQIDTVSRGLLGLTVACARCHDHKYDAIPQKDYYSLYGVFASSEAPFDAPRIDGGVNSPAAAAFEKHLAQKRGDLIQLIDKQHKLLTATARARVADYLVHVVTQKPDPLEEAIYFMLLSPKELRPPLVGSWRRYLEKHARPDDPVFGPWHDLMQLPAEDFAAAARLVVARWRSVPVGVAAGQANPLIVEALAAASLTGKADVARLYGSVLKRVYDESGKNASTGSVPERRQLLNILVGDHGPTYFPKQRTYLYMSRQDRDAYEVNKLVLDTLAVASPAAPPRAMVLVDSPELCNPRVFVRGNPAVPGEAVPRQFLRIVGGDERRPFAHGSGRLDLAKAITDPANPLTSRVLVNRVWMHHFGEPLVSTPSDFGTRSTPPSHPELLDWLAHTLQEDGWSLKKLHRRILLSRTYQQASLDRPECRKVDPDNRLLWHFPRHRLDLESMRDTLLAVSGRLDRTQGGRPVEVAADPLNRRRTVYGKVDRQDLPALFRAFDFAVPDQSVERRPQTTVPQQALFGLNGPFVVEQAKALAARPEVAGAGSDEARVAALYRLVLSRPPEPAEVQLALAFVNGQEKKDGSTLTPWQQYTQVLMLTNEAMFVD